MNSWRTVELGEVARLVGGSTPTRNNSEYWNGNIPWVTPTDITNLSGMYVDDTSDHITTKGLEDTALSIIPVGSVIMTSRATIGYPAINRAPLTTNQGCISFLCSDHVHNQYLYYVLQHLRPTLEKLASGSTFKELTKSTARKIPIPLPPLPEQRRIAEILGSVDDVTSIYTSEKARHNLLLAEVRDRIFESLNGNPTPLSESLLETKYGTSKPNNDRGLGYPVLRIPNIVEGTIRIDDLKFVDLSALEYESLRLHPGDLLIVRTNGNPDYVGRCVVTGHDEDGMAFASYLIRLKVKDNVNPVFVRHYLLSSLGRQHLAGNIRTSAGNYNLNSESIKELPIVTPSKAEQDAYVLRLSALEALIEKDELVIRKLLHLKTALMQRLLASQHQVAI